MFFKLDTFANRLTATSSRVAFNPAGLKPLAGEPFQEPEFIFESQKVKPVKLEKDVRYIHSTGAASAGATAEALGVIPASQGYSRISQLQNAWLANDNLMVWQKRGMRDTGAYYVTLGMCVAGVAGCLYLIARMSFPKKPE